jgi:hypothetical protein
MLISPNNCFSFRKTDFKFVIVMDMNECLFLVIFSRGLVGKSFITNKMFIE